MCNEVFYTMLKTLTLGKAVGVGGSVALKMLIKRKSSVNDNKVRNKTREKYKKCQWQTLDRATAVYSKLAVHVFSRPYI